MTKLTLCITVATLITAGCVSSPQSRDKQTDSPTSSGASDSVQVISQVEYEEPFVAELLQPPTVVESIETAFGKPIGLKNPKQARVYQIHK